MEPFRIGLDPQDVVDVRNVVGVEIASAEDAEYFAEVPLVLEEGLGGAVARFGALPQIPHLVQADVVAQLA